MLIAIDIGNTTTVVGVYESQRLVKHWRLGTSSQRSADEYAMVITQLLAMANLSLCDINAAILSCVVPSIEPIVVDMLANYCHVQPMVVGPNTNTGLMFQNVDAHEVGADRIVNAVAALDKYPPPLIIVDFGTATTFDAIGMGGVYLGGAIAPGVDISMEALFQRASKLPRVQFIKPRRVIGTTTISSIQSGLFYGYVGLVDNIIECMQKELHGKAHVLTTGGLGKLIAPALRYLYEVDNLLTLKGLIIIYERNKNNS